MTEYRTLATGGATKPHPSRARALAYALITARETRQWVGVERLTRDEWWLIDSIEPPKEKNA